MYNIKYLSPTVLNAQCVKVFITSFITFILSRLKTNRLPGNHFLIHDNTKFETTDYMKLFSRNYDTSVVSKCYGF